jgi:hydrogenase maturation protein HypF
MILAHDKPDLIAARFHVGLVELFVDRLIICRDKYGLNTVALSGGVHQNASFAHYLLDRLKQERFNCITHRQVPANDGGLALGQLLVADHQARQKDNNL